MQGLLWHMHTMHRFSLCTATMYKQARGLLCDALGSTGGKVRAAEHTGGAVPAGCPPLPVPLVPADTTVLGNPRARWRHRDAREEVRCNLPMPTMKLVSKGLVFPCNQIANFCKLKQTSWKHAEIPSISWKAAKLSTK